MQFRLVPKLRTGALLRRRGHDGLAYVTVSE